MRVVIILFLIVVMGIMIQHKSDTDNGTTTQDTESESQDRREFSRTIDMLPPYAYDVRLLGNGWLTFRLFGNCMLLSSQYKSSASSGALITTLSDDSCDNTQTDTTFTYKNPNKNPPEPVGLY